MTKIIAYGQEREMIDCWEELMMGTYMEFIKLDQHKKDFDDWTLLLKLTEVLCGKPFTVEMNDDFDISANEAIDIDKAQQWILTPPPVPTFKHIKIGDIDYVMVNPMDMYTREKLAIENAQLHNPGQPWNYYPIIMAILVRPAKLKIKAETGKEYWDIDKFNMDQLPDRIEIFNKHLPVPVVDSVVKQYFLLSNS